MSYTFNLAPILKNLDGLFQGVQITLFLSVTSMMCAFVLGIILALAKLSASRIASLLASIYIEFIRNTPLLVHLIWIYYCMPIILGINLPALQAAILGLTVAEAAVLAEIVRAGIQGVQRGQTEAASAAGFSRYVTFRRIVLPQALRLMTPPLLNSYVSLLKATALVAIIAVPDLMFVAQRIASETFRPIEILSLAALLYFAITYPFVLVVRYVEYRGRRRVGVAAS